MVASFSVGVWNLEDEFPAVRSFTERFAITQQAGFARNCQDVI